MKALGFLPSSATSVLMPVSKSFNHVCLGFPLASENSNSSLLHRVGEDHFYHVCEVLPK